MAGSCLMMVGELPSYLELALFVKTHRFCYRPGQGVGLSQSKENEGKKRPFSVML
jgi:hypothetical protein